MNNNRRGPKENKVKIMLFDIILTKNDVKMTFFVIFDQYMKMTLF